MSYNDAPISGVTDQIIEARLQTYPPMVNLADFLAEDIALPPELVEGLIHQGTMTMIAAPPKSRKSWLMFQLALSVASGVPLLGRETKQCKVVIVNPEIDAPFVRHRISKAFLALSEAGYAINLRNLELQNLRRCDFDVETLCELIRRRAGDAGLICLDSLYQFLGARDENSARDMGDLLRKVDQISAKTGAAIVFTHHFAKGNAALKDALDRSSGSGVLGRYPDGIITMTRHKDEGVYTVESVLRNFPPADKFAVTFEGALIKVAEDVDPDQLKGKGGPPKKYDWINTVNALKDGMTRAAWQKKVISKTEMSEGTFRSHVKLLLSEKLIEQYGKNLFRHCSKSSPAGTN